MKTFASIVTTRDIAVMTGVNQSTVSRALSGSSRIGARTKKKIWKACRALNFVPNAIARGLRERRSRTLAVHIPFGSETVLSDPFVLEFLAGVSQEAGRRGYAMVLSYPDPEQRGNEFVNLVKSRRADGIIITSSLRHDPRLALLARERIPCVVSRQGIRLGAMMACVDIDNREIACEAVRYLLAQGHQRLGIITEEVDSLSAYDFLAGCRDALREHGWRVRDARIKRVPVTFQSAYEATRKILAERPAPDAILTNTALTIFGVLTAIRDAGKSILAMGLDSPLLRGMYPELPRIQSPILDLGRKSSAVLIEMLETGRRPAQEVLLHARVAPHA